MPYLPRLLSWAGFPSSSERDKRLGADRDVVAKEYEPEETETSLGLTLESRAYVDSNTLVGFHGHIKGESLRATDELTVSPAASGGSYDQLLRSTRKHLKNALAKEKHRILNASAEDTDSDDQADMEDHVLGQIQDALYGLPDSLSPTPKSCRSFASSFSRATTMRHQTPPLGATSPTSRASAQSRGTSLTFVTGSLWERLRPRELPRERMEMLRKEVEVDKTLLRSSTMDGIRSYQELMREKFERLGVLGSDESVFLDTNSPTKAVKAILRKHHQLCAEGVLDDNSEHDGIVQDELDMLDNFVKVLTSDPEVPQVLAPKTQKKHRRKSAQRSSSMWSKLITIPTVRPLSRVTRFIRALKPQQGRGGA